MLNLTRKTDYALVALIHLANRRRDGEGAVSAKHIAEAFGLPTALLMNVMKELAAAKILTSTRGARGGYELAADPDHVTLLEVITATEGPVRFAMCADGLPIMGQGCPIENGCPIRGPIRKLHQRINDFLDNTTLADLQDNNLPIHAQTPAVTAAAAT